MALAPVVTTAVYKAVTFELATTALLPRVAEIVDVAPLRGRDVPPARDTGPPPLFARAPLSLRAPPLA